MKQKTMYKHLDRLIQQENAILEITTLDIPSEPSAYVGVIGTLMGVENTIHSLLEDLNAQAGIIQLVNTHHQKRRKNNVII